jgi:hypothetical protein
MTDTWGFRPAHRHFAVQSAVHATADRSFRMPRASVRIVLAAGHELTEPVVRSRVWRPVRCGAPPGRSSFEDSIRLRSRSSSQQSTRE